MLRKGFRLCDAVRHQLETDGLLFTTLLAAAAVHAQEGDAAVVDANALWKRLGFTRVEQRLRASVYARGAKRAFALQKIEVRHFTDSQTDDVGFAGRDAFAAAITTLLSPPPWQSDAVSRRYALPGKEFTSRQRHRFTLNGGKRDGA
jgi:hypothetical protein